MSVDVQVEDGTTYTDSSRTRAAVRSAQPVRSQWFGLLGLVLWLRFVDYVDKLSVSSCGAYRSRTDPVLCVNTIADSRRSPATMSIAQ